MREDDIRQEEEESRRRVREAQRRAEEKSARRALEEEKRSREAGGGEKKSVGGWIAAVVSLSVAVLALGAVVTVGYFDLRDAKGSLADGMRGAVYEFAGLVEDLDANLAKARLTQSDREMQKVLADVLVDSVLAEKCLEAFPVDSHAAEQLTAYVNRTGDYARTLLHKLASGVSLSEEEREVVDYLCETTGKVRAALPALVEGASGGFDKLTEGFSVLFGKLNEPVTEVPKSIEDGPFAQGSAKRESEYLKGERALSDAELFRAAEKALSPLSPVGLRADGCTQSGEGYACFRFEDEAGNGYSAQLSVRGGRLALLTGFAPCGKENYDADACAQIAQKFLEGCGYADMTPVWTGEAGGACVINFVREQDGVLLYPEMIKVKVCEARGTVTGFDAHAWLVNHRERELPVPTVPMERIRANAESRMELYGIRTALIPCEGEEVLAYEIRGEYGGRVYYAYVDALTGETADIFTLVHTDGGDKLL